VRLLTVKKIEEFELVIPAPAYARVNVGGNPGVITMITFTLVCHSRGACPRPRSGGGNPAFRNKKRPLAREIKVKEMTGLSFFSKYNNGWIPVFTGMTDQRVKGLAEEDGEKNL
jgi:hypothetical protein